eukprot:1470267-Pyramimonas_sp.AAC.1
MAPAEGHPGGGRWPSTTRGGSGGMLAYSATRSTDTTWDSQSEAMRTSQLKDCVTFSAYVIDRPAMPASSDPFCVT